jgi:hypothetical protein
MNRKVIAGAVLSLALGSGLLGCTTPTPTTGPSVDPSRVSPTNLPTAPVVKDPQGDIKDLTLGECKTEAGEQTVTGELTSTLTEAKDFLVTVSWTTASGDVMGRGFKVLKALEPGKNTKFEIKATVAPGATQCVKGVEYGTIEG